MEKLPEDTKAEYMHLCRVLRALNGASSAPARTADPKLRTNQNTKPSTRHCNPQEECGGMFDFDEIEERRAMIKAWCSGFKSPDGSVQISCCLRDDNSRVYLEEADAARNPATAWRSGSCSIVPSHVLHMFACASELSSTG